MKNPLEVLEWLQSALQTQKTRTTTHVGFQQTTNANVAKPKTS